MRKIGCAVAMLCGLGMGSGNAAVENNLSPAPLTAQTTQQSVERTIGTCQPIENKPESKISAINSVAPVGPAEDYLTRIEHRTIDVSDLVNAKLTILQRPAHGRLQGDQSGSFMYVSSDYHYEGQDTAIVLVEMGGYKVKVIYYFNLMQNVPGSSDEGTAYDDKAICPNGYVWKISLNSAGIGRNNQRALPRMNFKQPVQCAAFIAPYCVADWFFHG